MAQTLVDLLANHGLRPKSFRPSARDRLVCPRCGGGRDKEKSVWVEIHQDGLGASWKCHRGTCDMGDVTERVEREAKLRRVIKPPPVHTEAQRNNRPDWLYDWFAARRIGARVVQKLGIYAGRKWFNEKLGEADAIVFSYSWKGEIVNRKYRPRGQKHPQSQEKDAAQTLFNIDALGDSPERIVWVEGEPDVAALMECGINDVVSLKDGAPSTANAANQARFEALANHAGVLTKAKRIILAGDMDGPGIALREELARRLGRHRCWLVDWPTGCKDAGDTLRDLGPDAVLGALGAARPYPIEGMHKITPEALMALRTRPAPGTITTGTMSSDNVLKLPIEGRLIVVTGFPAAGKTSWLRFVMVHTATNHSRRWCVFSPESQPWEFFMAECAEVYARKPFYPVHGVDSMTDDDIAEAGAFLADRITMLVCDAEDQAPSADWLFERVSAAVLRDGVTDFAIDPFNEIDQQRGSMTETDYIGRFLQRCRAFSQRYGCNVWIAAHPAKPPPLKPKERRNAPGPYDINGSAHWANKSDIGLTIHNADGLTELHVWKTKQKRWGHKGTVAKMNFDPLTGNYTSWTDTSEVQTEGPPDWVLK
jgi:twinkle protein